MSLCKVSIHASVKDATERSIALVFRHFGFNPRIRKRCDFCVLLYNLSVDSFNPRIRKRCDFRYRFYSFWTNVSIHASVKDATPLHRLQCLFLSVSIHASVKDATWMLDNYSERASFQSTHP